MASDKGASFNRKMFTQQFLINFNRKMFVFKLLVSLAVVLCSSVSASQVLVSYYEPGTNCKTLNSNSFKTLNVCNTRPGTVGIYENWILYQTTLLSQYCYTDQCKTPCSANPVRNYYPSCTGDASFVIVSKIGDFN